MKFACGYLEEKLDGVRNVCRKNLEAIWNGKNVRLEQLTPYTTFTKTQLQALHVEYKKLAEVDGGLTKEQFIRIMDQSGLDYLDKREILDRLFSLFDSDGSGVINFSEFICALSALCAETPEDRMKLCFMVFDLDRSGFLDAEEVRAMAESLAPMVQIQRNLPSFKGSTLSASSSSQASTSMSSSSQVSSPSISSQTTVSPSSQTTVSPSDDWNPFSPSTSESITSPSEIDDDWEDVKEHSKQFESLESSLEYASKENFVDVFIARLTMMDTNNNGKLSLSEFMEGVTNEPLFLRLFTTGAKITPNVLRDADQNLVSKGLSKFKGLLNSTIDI